MIFWTSGSQGKPIRVVTARILTSVALGLYPIGALTRHFGPDTLTSAVMGVACIVASFGCAVVLAGSSIQRIVADVEGELDEYEIKLRYRAIQGAYLLITAMSLIGVFVFQVANDLTGFAGRIAINDGLLTGLFWGLALYASMLPTAVLAWQLSPNDDPGPKDVEHG